MKIDCPDCARKIQIDRAFAGGVCRCPYCKELVFVPGRIENGGGPRPETPGKRPEAPDAEPQASKAHKASVQEVAAAEAVQEQIPTADPAKKWGVIAIILVAAVLVLMLTVAITLAVFQSQR